MRMRRTPGATSSIATAKGTRGTRRHASSNGCQRASLTHRATIGRSYGAVVGAEGAVVARRCGCRRWSQTAPRTWRGSCPLRPRRRGRVPTGARRARPWHGVGAAVGDVDPPGSGDPAVHQHGAEHAAVPAVQRRAAALGPGSAGGRHGRTARCRTRGGTGAAPACRGRVGGRRAGRTARGRRRPGTSAGRAGGGRGPLAAGSARTTAGRPARSPARTQPGSAARCRSGVGSVPTSRPSHASVVVHADGPVAPHTPRGVTCTSAARYVTVYERASWSSAGQRAASRGPSSARVRGRSASSSRPAATMPAMSPAPIWRPNGLAVRWCRSQTAWTTGRSVHASSAVTRWSVLRMSGARTTGRLVRRSARASGVNRARRDHRPTYGAFGACACIPTRWSTAASGGSSWRRRRSCRSRVARLRARRSSRSPVTDARYAPTAPADGACGHAARGSGLAERRGPSRRWA